MDFAVDAFSVLHKHYLCIQDMFVCARVFHHDMKIRTVCHLNAFFSVRTLMAQD